MLINATNIETAVHQIVSEHLEDSSNSAPKDIYFDGWGCGLGASAVLRAIAEHPPPSLWEKFDKIIHIDCTRWKSRRALQRAIADELNLTQQVAADFDRQDEEDDFSGLDQGSRAEIPDVATVIARSLAQYRYLVIFHNGSDGMVDLASCGIPPPQLFSAKVLWCFSGRIRANIELFQDQNSSHCPCRANKGRIWRTNLAWRRLPNLRKLRVVKATRYWRETDRKAQGEVMDMVKMELLDLSGNKTMQVLPSLSGATGLKTLVLDGCAGLDHVGPRGLPPSLESFCFDAGDDKDARISCISLAGCSRFADFRLSGSLPKLEELDLSQTAVKMLDLRKVTDVDQSLERVCLVGCEHLRSISWPQTIMQQLRLLRIDTRSSGQEVARKPSSPGDSLMVFQQDRRELHAFVAVADVRFFQSLEFLWTETTQPKMYLCLSSTSISNDDGRSCHEKMGCTYSSSTGQLLLAAGLPLPYHDVSLVQAATKLDGSRSSSAMQFQPLDFHMEIGDGVSDITNVATTIHGQTSIAMVMNKVESLHVHDSSSITTVVPEYIFLPSPQFFHRLKWCRVERCPKLGTVFVIYEYAQCFYELETFWAAHLLMARSIWSGGGTRLGSAAYRYESFSKLRVIHIHSCPRLRFVLPLSSNQSLPYVLETLHVFCCGDLRQIFPVDQEFQEKLAASRETKGMLEFRNLKHLYLHHLSSLELICEAKMYAPNLETIYIRGCWGLRRLPATAAGRRQDGRPVAVDCEKDWWDKLEWDGMESGHHPSLFQPRHSKHYKKRHLRRTVLR